MAVSCTPQDLVSNATQFCCITGETAQQVKLYLLRHIAGLDSMTPQELLAASSCFLSCVPPGAYKAVESYLLCQIANAGGTVSGEGLVWGPAATTLDKVEFDNARLVDSLGASITTIEFPTLASVTGNLTFENNAEVTSVEAPLLTSVGANFNFFNSVISTVSFPALVSATGATGILFDNSFISSISLPALTTITTDISAKNTVNLTSVSFPAIATVPANVTFFAAGVLTSINFPLLVTVGGFFETPTALSLPSLSLPSIVTITGGLFCNNCPLLVSFSAPNWVPTDGTTITFNGDALDIPSVEIVLRRCVLAGVTTCTIDLSGGTNAGTASLSAQGQADVATLGAQVTMNP